MLLKTCIVILAGLLVTLAESPVMAAEPAAKTVEERLQELEAEIKQLRGQQQTPNQATPLSMTAPPEDSSSEPFAWGDFTWLNGNSRQHSRIFDSKYFTGQVDIDINYTYSFWHPNDDTVVGSTALARNNEVEVSFIGFGGDMHWNDIRGRLLTQFGTRSTVVPRNDNSTLRGQFDLQTAYRYISEGYAGYHWEKLHGINLDGGIFMSYVGLFSYDNFENWSYQPSFTSDNTPWFFNGLRLQVFPTDRFKAELWLINGWQTYGKFNELPGVGYQLLYRPVEWTSFVFNGYTGTDTQDHPGRVRIHSDNSWLLRWYNRPELFFHRAAFSITADLGFEQGDGVTPFGGSGHEGSCTNRTPCDQNFISAMAYQRFWFWNGFFGLTVGGGFIHNPGRYLVLIPTGAAGQEFDTNPGSPFDGWDFSTNLQVMPNDWLTWELEFVHRQASIPYFAGPGGVTSPDGYTNSAVPAGWQPDLRKYENRVVLAAVMRF